MPSFEILIIGGSYAGLSAAMTLGRSRRKVLVVDSGHPCNAAATEAHNIILADGRQPAALAALARNGVLQYETVQWLQDTATEAGRTPDGFYIITAAGNRYEGSYLLFATGMKDGLPLLPGLQDCWGKSVLHCPYCHGYEVRDAALGILANGEMALEFSQLLYQWSRRLTVYTDGSPGCTPGLLKALEDYGIDVVNKKLVRAVHKEGMLEKLVFEDGSSAACTALFTRPVSEQHCMLPLSLGCETGAQQLLQVDSFQRTTIPGIYAAGDNSHPFRSIAIAMAAGTMAGAAMNRDLQLKTMNLTRPVAV